jgi:hypothetical protein
MEQKIIVKCPSMSLSEMRDYCEAYQCEVLNTGVVGVYKLFGKDAHIVREELNLDGYLE